MFIAHNLAILHHISTLMHLGGIVEISDRDDL
jgi:ABC-type oligopeptide transport system ATPase subunit